VGYTHYYTTKAPITPSDWSKIAERARKLIEKSPVPLAYEYDEADEPPIADEEVIRFNGVDDDGHETFVVTPDKVGFGFCKTAQKPYDLVVVACLLVLNKVLGDKIEVSSDGDAEEWHDGKAYAETTLDETFKMPRRVRPAERRNDEEE